MDNTHPHLGPWKLLGKDPNDGTCDQCATAHAPEMPHNQQSLFWNYDFFGKNGRWPKWSDAMAHCTDEMKTLWTKALRDRGIDIT